MPHAVTVFDEILGQRQPAVTLDLPAPTITARELIRARIFAEVQGHNRQLETRGPGGEAPPADGRRLHGRKLDWHEQAQLALEAFDRQGFVLLVDDRQVLSLSDEIRLRPETEVVFLKLVPLAGG